MDDFAEAPRTLFFLSQDTSRATTIFIVDDAEIENSELFILELSSDDPIVHIPMPNSTVLILDNDGK